MASKDVYEKAESDSAMGATAVSRDSDDLSPVEESTSDPEKGEGKLHRTVTAQDWTGPDDPGNPQNWPTIKKTFHTGATACLGFAVTVASSMITPATPEIARYFDISRTAAILSLSLYVLGLALGPCLAAPISETYGRSVVYKISSITYMLFILGAGFSKSLPSLLICRLLAGMFGGPVLAVGAGTNADMYSPKNRAVATAFFVMMPFLGPAVGPVIGGFAAQFRGWRWTQWCTIFIGIAAAVPIFLMSETSKKIILRGRAKKLGIPGPPSPPQKAVQRMKAFFVITLARPARMLFTEPIVAFFSLYTAFTFSVLFGFFAAYPYTFQGVYGFSTWQYGLTFLGIGLGNFIGIATVIATDKFYYAKHTRLALAEGKTQIAPEYRLMAAQMGSIGLPIGLFWFAWSARPDVHWISPVLAGVPFAWGNVCVFSSAATYLIDTYGMMNGASAMAANGLARYGLGAAFPLFTFQMYERLGIDWATSLLAFVSLAMLPIPWIFFKYGPAIRAKSQYDVVKF